MRFFGSLLALSLLFGLVVSPTNASIFEEDEIQLRPAPDMRKAGVMDFLHKTMAGFKAAHMRKLRAGKVIKFKAARSFKTRGRGFGFRRGDVLKVRMTKNGKFIIDDNDKSTKGIILHHGKSKMGIVVIERDTGKKQFGRAIVAENDRIVVAPKMKKGAFKGLLDKKGLKGKKVRNR